MNERQKNEEENENSIFLLTVRRRPIADALVVFFSRLPWLSHSL